MFAFYKTEGPLHFGLTDVSEPLPFDAVILGVADSQIHWFTPPPVWAEAIAAVWFPGARGTVLHNPILVSVDEDGELELFRAEVPLRAEQKLCAFVSDEETKVWHLATRVARYALSELARGSQL